MPAVQLTTHVKSSTLFGRTFKFFQLEGLLLFCIIIVLRELHYYTFVIHHFLFKVHGGTTYEDIKLKVHQAEEMARANQDKNIDTVLFFDEANTTEALTMIKEVMVDRRINGRPIRQGLERLQFIAACNPYRR